MNEQRKKYLAEDRTVASPPTPFKRHDIAALYEAKASSKLEFASCCTAWLI